jgi:hypothetical protein
MNNVLLVKPSCQLVAMFCVSLMPPLEVYLGGKEIAFLGITVLMGEHEVVTQINGIPRPWNEVINFNFVG